MAARRKRQEADREKQPLEVLSQQDESDILAEVGAEPDEDGDLIADEEKIRKIGAVDAESVIENRRLESGVDQKRIGGGRFNAGDILTKFETTIKTFPMSTLYITVRRLNIANAPLNVISNMPRSGAEFYEAIKAIHGQTEEAEYFVEGKDGTTSVFRFKGKIVMPDTRIPQQQGYPPPQQQPQPQPGPVVVQAPAPDMGSMVSSMKQMFEMFQSMQKQTAATQQTPYSPPLPSTAPAGPDMGTMFDSMKQMLGLFQSMQPAVTPTVQPTAQQSYPVPAGPDMNSMMSWMQQMFQMFQSMQPPPPPPQTPPSRGNAHHQAPPPPQNPMAAMMGGMMGMPAGMPMQPPAGTMWVPGLGFVPLDRLAQAMGVGQPSQPQQPERPLYRGPSRPGERPAYYPRESGGGPDNRYPDPRDGRYPDPRDGRYPDPRDERYPDPREGRYPDRYAAPPPRQPTPGEQFRDSITVLRTAAQAMEEFRSILPDRNDGSSEIAPEADDSPVKVIDTGGAKIVVNKEDGTMRGFETVWANMDKMLKWAGEQREAIQKANERQQSQQQRQLRPGYVEVGPGYQPPPGYVAVPVDESESELTPPPEHMPPPIQESPAPPSHTWETPTFPRP